MPCSPRRCSARDAVSIRARARRLSGSACYKPIFALLAPIALQPEEHWRAFTPPRHRRAIVALSVTCFGLAPWLAYLNELAGAAVYETGRSSLAGYVTPFGAHDSRPAPTAAYALQLGIRSHPNDNLLALAPRRRPGPPRRRTRSRHPAQLPVACSMNLMIAASPYCGWSRRHRDGFLPGKSCCSPSATHAAGLPLCRRGIGIRSPRSRRSFCSR